MAGTNPGFPAAQFRTAIRNAAIMAQPNDALVRPVFHWDPVRVSAHADSAGRPFVFNGSVTPAVTSIADLYVETVVAAVEKTAELIEGNRAGEFRGSQLTLTILDVDMATIRAHGGGRFADSVLVADTEYRVTEIPKPDALFDVDVFTIHCYTSSIAKSV